MDTTSAMAHALLFALFVSLEILESLYPLLGCAIIVLVFALAQGLFWIGVASTFVMGLGTAITVAVVASIALLLLVCLVPPLQTVFNTHFMSLREWSVVIGLSLMPAVAEEIMKVFLRMRRKL